jgi:hypothetical protein
VRRSKLRATKIESRLEGFGEAKVAQLDHERRGEKAILRFDVPVQNFAIVQMLHGATELREPARDLPLGRHRGHDLFMEIPALGEVHHDLQLRPLQKVVPESDNVHMVHACKDSDLQQRRFALPRRQPRRLDGFHHDSGTGPGLYERHAAKAPAADVPDVSVRPHRLA